VARNNGGRRSEGKGGIGGLTCGPRQNGALVHRAMGWVSDEQAQVVVRERRNGGD
jgi:hypothetical protein